MKNILFYITIIILLFACNKDSISYEENTFVSDPEEIKWPFVYGQIESETGEKLANVKIDVYQNDSLIGSVNSDSEGKYSTHKIKSNTEYPITIKYQKQDYLNKYRRFEFETSHYSKKNIVIGKETSSSDIKKENFEITNPTDTNMIKIYGYATLSDGTPISGVSCEALWQYFKTTNALWCQKYNLDYSDQDGYFELLVPKRKVIHFQASKRRYPDQLMAPCFEFFSDENPVGALSQWHYMELGQFEDNYNIILRDDIEFLTLSGTVNGRVLSCEGNPINTAEISMSLIYKGFIPVSVYKNNGYIFGQNGEFNISFETCPFEISTLSDYKIKIFIKDTIAKYSGAKEIAYSEIADIGDIKLCFDDNYYPGELDLNLGSENRFFPKSYDSPESGKDKLRMTFSYNEGDQYEVVFLNTEQVKLGEVPVLWFKYWKGKKESDNFVHVYETTFDAKPEEVTMTITKIEDNYVYGNVIGEVGTPQGRKPVNATFRVYNK